MLHKAYAEVNLDLAEEMVFLFLNPFEPSLTSKLVTAMFNLKEIEGTIHLGMTDEGEIEQYGNKCVVRILLSPVAKGDLVDDDELDHYIESIFNVCQVNRRLKHAFFLYKLPLPLALLQLEMDKHSIDVLKKISSKIANSFS